VQTAAVTQEIPTIFQNGMLTARISKQPFETKTNNRLPLKSDVQSQLKRLDRPLNQSMATRNSYDASKTSSYERQSVVKS